MQIRVPYDAARMNGTKAVVTQFLEVDNGALSPLQIHLDRGYQQEDGLRLLFQGAGITPL